MPNAYGVEDLVKRLAFGSINGTQEFLQFLFAQPLPGALREPVQKCQQVLPFVSIHAPPSRSHASADGPMSNSSACARSRARSRMSAAMGTVVPMACSRNACHGAPAREAAHSHSGRRFEHRARLLETGVAERLDRSPFLFRYLHTASACTRWMCLVLIGGCGGFVQDRGFAPFLGRTRMECVEVTCVSDPALLNEQFDDFGTQPVDVHGLSANKMLDAPQHLRRASGLVWAIMLGLSSSRPTPCRTLGKP